MWCDKKDIVMKTEKKFTWCVRYYNVVTGVVEYRMYFGWTTREINELAANFVEVYKDYMVRVFKQSKSF